ncbi:MAG TPA: hypothetical protein VGO64_05675 [Candidatus Limnocylindrales bacterium]|jgi:hypothetical protein|nr:hypothetical protein [Candidatus Limnocylindrales bacterium]
MRTRPASIATIVIAIGLGLTSTGIAGSLPYTFAGLGGRTTVAADVWAHGTAISPSLVALVFVGLLGAIAMRPTHGGRRAARSLAVLAGAISLVGLAEPAQRDAILFASVDAITVAVWAFHLALIALVLSAVGEARRQVIAEDAKPDTGVGFGPAAGAGAAA